MTETGSFMFGNFESIKKATQDTEKRKIKIE